MTTTFGAYPDIGPGDSMTLPFTPVSRSHVKVYADGALVSSSLYTYSNDTTIVAGAGFPAASQVVIRRETPVDEPLDLDRTGALHVPTINNNADKAWRSLEEHRDLLEMTAKVRPGETIGADRTAVMGADGFLVAGPTVDEVSNAQEYAERAETAAETSDWVSPPSAVDGADVLMVKDEAGAIKITPLPFITPEMHGAIGDGESHPLSERFATLLTAQMKYPEAVSLTDEIDWCAWQRTIAAMRLAGVRVEGLGRYVTHRKISLSKPSNREYWDGSTDLRPDDVYIRQIKTTSTDKAIEFNGSLINDRLHVGHMIGPGIGAVGTPGGTSERIGVLLTGSVDFKLESATDFNFGVVMQGCFSFHIDVGFTLACLKGVHSRVTPGTTDGTNQSGYLRVRKAGGPYTHEGFANDELRRSRGCDRGVDLQDMHGAILDLGSPEYCQMEDDSVGVVLGAGASKNTIWVYLEGARDDGEFFHCLGANNTIHFAGLGSPNNVKIGAIRVSGLGNHIYGLGDVLGAAASAGYAPQGSFGIVQIAPGNNVHGKYKQWVQKAPSILRANLLTDANTFTASSGLTVTTESDVPAGHDFKESYEFTVSNSDVKWYTSGNITVTGETRTIVRVKTAVRGITNHPKIAFYLLTGGGTLLDGKQSITTDPNDPDWSIIEYLAEIGSGHTNILFRYSIRNTSPGETGGVLRACRPLISYNLTGPMVRSNAVMPDDNGIPGTHFPKSVLAMQGFRYQKHTVTDIVSTVFDVNSSGLVECTAHPSGSSVNLINSLIEGQPCMIVNNSGSSITFTTSALTGAQVVLADGEGFTVVKMPGASKATRVG